MQGMWASQELLPLWLLVLAAGGSVHAYRPSRRVCAAGAAPGSVSESFVQRVYQPFLTTCDGHRACSTYRTIYRTAYRRGPGPGPTRPRYACCPGWKRTGGLPGACAAAICQPPCGNGGSCVRPGRCHCPAGWQGNTCHTDVDECSSGGVGCPQGCVNTAGSYQCQCREGHSASADGTHCLPTAGPPRVALNPVTGVDPAARAEVQRLQARVEVLEQVRPAEAAGSWQGWERSWPGGGWLRLSRAHREWGCRPSHPTWHTAFPRSFSPGPPRPGHCAARPSAPDVDVPLPGLGTCGATVPPGVEQTPQPAGSWIEGAGSLGQRSIRIPQKLQLVLDPLHGLASQAPEQGPQAPGSLLAHSLQQLDRIDSLSEQISFLEEQLGSCSCKQL